MKRMIALVLSLVMALSLCAPAWGAEGATKLPKAKVTTLGATTVGATAGIGGAASELNLDAAYQFEPTETYEQAQKSDYRYWHADFVVSADKDVAADSVALAGYYDAWCQYNNDNWVALTGPEVAAGEEIRLVYGMGGGSITVNYEELCNYGNDGIGFRCGLADVGSEADGTANTGTTITVELRLYETEEPSEENGNSHNVETGKYVVIGTYSHTFKGVAEVAGKEYKTLQAALDVGGDVKLLENVTLDETATIAAGKNVTLNLNGKTITAPVGAICAVKNEGTLTVEGNGTIAGGYSALYSNGNLTINGGNFTATDGFGLLVDNIYGTEDSVAVINNGTFTGVGVYNPANVTIKGGTFNVGRDPDGASDHISDEMTLFVSPTFVGAPNTATVKLDGGTFNGDIYIYDDGITETDVTINDGNFSGDFLGNASVNYDKVVLDVFTVKGGYFTVDPKAYVAEGYGFLTSDKSGYDYKVGKVVATVGKVNYATLQDAVDAVADKGTITVKANGQSATVSAAKTFTVVYADGVTKANITAGSGYTLSEKDGVYTVSKYVAPYYPPVTETPTEKPAETPAEKPAQTPTQTPTTPAETPVEVVVPVVGNENTVKVEATVTGTTATVDKVDMAQLETVIGSDVDTGKVTIDFSTTTVTTGAVDSNGEIVEAAPVDTVQIPAEVIAEIAEAVADPENNAESLEVVLGDGASIEFDAAALAEKVAQAGGDDITISIKPTTAVADTLSQAQIFTLGESVAFDITVTSGGVEISDMGGNITISAPYELAEGETAEGIVVYYVDDAGNREKCETVYDAATGRVSWVTNHLSVYMVSYEAPVEDVTPDDGAVDETPVVDDAQSGSPVLWIVIAVVVIAAIVVAVVVSKKRKA